MKRNFKNITTALVFVTALGASSCKKSLEEYNPSVTTISTAYENKTGFEGLINACYVDMYYYYGKTDFIGPSEMGTDLWTAFTTQDPGFTNYDVQLAPNLGVVGTIWGGWYSCANLCNTAIYFAKNVKGYGSTTEVNSKVAEAHFLRAWSYFNIVEQFGGVVLRTDPTVVSGVDITPKRSPETAFYDLIIADLQFAADNLPVTQTLRGRVTKKAALGLLAKACLQRTRLGDKEKYAQMALDAAEKLINTPGTYNCALYTSDATTSGYTKLFDGKNNKNNTEFLWAQTNDVTGLNPEGFNRGRTRQYYLPDLGGKGVAFGTRDGSILYGRANAKTYKPSKYLLVDIFDARQNTPDTRFANTFTYKFYANTDTKITQATATLYKKDQSVVDKTILGTTAQYAGPDYFLAAGAQLEEEKNMANDAGLAVFVPNWNIPADQKAKALYMIADPSDLFDPATGTYKVAASFPNEANYAGIFPAFRKYSSKMWVYTNQYWLGDIGILRLGETYLIAAEAALILNNPGKAAGYVTTLRRRAALSGRQAEMDVNAGQINTKFILDERARELAGEHTRWIDLKRTGFLTKEYLTLTNPTAAPKFTPSKHLVRPVPLSFLDQIVNAKDFGTNGY